MRIEDRVPLLTAYLAAYGFLLNHALFLVFIDGMGKTLRPISAFLSIGLTARKIIHTVYPSPLKDLRSLTADYYLQPPRGWLFPCQI